MHRFSDALGLVYIGNHCAVLLQELKKCFCLPKLSVPKGKMQYSRKVEKAFLNRKTRSAERRSESSAVLYDPTLTGYIDSSHIVSKYLLIYYKAVKAITKEILEYCFAREKENVFAWQKQSVPMSINDFVEMTILQCLICFSIYRKMQGFVDECVLGCFFVVAFYAEIQDGCQKWRENNFWQ